MNRSDSKWRVSTINEFILENGGSIKTGPFGTTLKAHEYSHEGVPVISTGEVGYGSVTITTKTPRVSSKVLERLAEYILQEGDIVFGRKGATDRSAYIKSTQNGWFLGSDGIRLRLPNTCEPLYIAYQLQSKSTRNWLVQHSTGTTMPSLNQEIIGRIPISLPPVSEQKKISWILKSLDDKIDLNRRMNETLESMARALFKSWFVDFDPVRAKMEGRKTGLPKHISDLFPSSFEDSELGKIPKGWPIRSLYDTATFVNGAPFSNEDFCNQTEGLPIIKIAELKEGISQQTKYSSKIVDDTQRISKGDLLYSWSGSPDISLDAFIWMSSPGLLNQHIFKVITSDSAQKRLVFYILKYLRPELVEIARNKQTTGLGHVTVADMKRLKVCWPSDRIRDVFDQQIEPFFMEVYRNKEESLTLSSLRDTLLPKLISGELRVKDTERFIGSMM